jgi:membrane protein DedA with SNARE-associated domain
MNAIGGTSWALLFGGGAYLFGEELRRVTKPVSLLLLIAAIGLIITGVIFFQRHEKEWEQRAEATFPGPLQ